MITEAIGVAASSILPAGIMLAAIIVDRVLGDPPDRYHPTAWAGRMIARMVPAFGERAGGWRRLWGAAVVVVSCAAVAGLAHLALLAISLPSIAALSAWPGLPLSVVVTVAWASVIGAYAVMVLLLKSTIAIRGMERHAMAVSARLEEGDVRGAGGRLASIVKRDTTNMDRKHICSGVVESVAESTVDGVTGPLFYFGAFGLPGALIYRTVNTVDSMAGYRSEIFRDVGWFGAKCDTILNWIPARLTGRVMALAASILGYDGAGARRSILRYAGRTESPNAGHAMAAMAGALGVTLEKPHHYTIGGGRDPDVDDIAGAVRIMKCTIWLFAGLICLPLMLASTALLSVLVWMVS